VRTKTKHVIGPVDWLPPGTQRRVEVLGRAIAIFNVSGRFYALRDVCPHQGAPLSAGVVVSVLNADRPGEYDFCPNRKHVRCPWHGWEYDLATGQSWYDPERDRVRAYEVGVEPGEKLVDGLASGPYVAETFSISVENDYIVLEM
jgi:3-phenylpropionate/trans-cinnamate dioxygenase ferredoxin subunit